MKSKLLMPLALVVGLLAVCGPILAHHGSAAYAETAVVLKDATVTKFVWANPHSFVMFDVKDDKGNVVHWATEASNPSDMVNLGWSKQTFKPGDEITVTFTPVKNGQPIGRIQQVVLANGQTLSARVVL